MPALHCSLLFLCILVLLHWPKGLFCCRKYVCVSKILCCAWWKSGSRLGSSAPAAQELTYTIVRTRMHTHKHWHACLSLAKSRENLEKSAGKRLNRCRRHRGMTNMQIWAAELWVRPEIEMIKRTVETEISTSFCVLLFGSCRICAHKCRRFPLLLEKLLSDWVHLRIHVIKSHTKKRTINQHILNRSTQQIISTATV